MASRSVSLKTLELLGINDAGTDGGTVSAAAADADANSDAAGFAASFSATVVQFVGDVSPPDFSTSCESPEFDMSCR